MAFATLILAAARRPPEPPAVLHVVGRVTESVFSLLGPLTHSLQRSGVRQTVVLVDAPELGPQIARFDDAVRVVAIATARPAWRHWLALRGAVRDQLRQTPPTTVHFHGLKPWLVAADLARAADIPVCLSPHGTHWFRRVALQLGRAQGDVAVTMDGSHRADPPDAAQRHVDGAVEESFFRVERREARRALVVAGSHHDNRKAIELFSRVAVVCGAAELDLAFNWFGPLSGAAAEQLQAAGVGTWPALADPSLASRLAAGWVFVACGGERDFPVLLAQAMAVGLPCLVADRDAYRALVRDGYTGLVYRDETHALELLTMLLDDAALRERLGTAARDEARQRFTARRLADQLAPLYLADHAARQRAVA